MTETLARLRAALSDRYSIEREIGRGGMAVVYLADDLKHGRRVALKVLEPGLAHAIGPERFLKEIEIVAQLTHPNILPLHDSGEADGLLYYVMPFVEDESLRVLLDREGQLPVEYTIAIVRDVAGALTYAHGRGVIHRDVKPGNILLPAGRPVLSDFGIARMADAAGKARLTETGLAIGSPGYMSPEQATGDRSLDERTDIYSLGCVAFEMLGGEPPFKGPNAQVILVRILTAPPAPLRELRREISGEIEGVIKRALSKAPEERFGSATEFADALVEASRAQGFAEDAYRQRRGRRWTLSAALSGMALLVLGGWWLTTRGPSPEARWATEVALPQILALTEEGRLSDAYQLAVDAERHIPESPILQSALTNISRYTSIRTVPEGATVEIRAYAAASTEWFDLGRTPLDPVRIPVGFFRWRISLPGYHTVEMASSGLQFPTVEAHRGLRLARAPEQSEGMVSVPGGETRLAIPGLFNQPPVTLGPYLLDRYEVTNREYKGFVDAGGYTDSTYWTESFVREGRRIPFADALAELVDRTGRPGPSTWLGGDYPRDQAEYPVVGISWFEALAYAQFAGKEVPTIYHWHRAAGADIAVHIVPMSNYGSEGLVAVGVLEGLGPFGTYAMAGNAKEWVRNTIGDQRYILGGSWDEPSYLFREAESRSPWDRAANHGLRLMLSADSVPPAALAAMQPFADPARTREVPDDVWAAYSALYEYDRGDLEAVVEDVEPTEGWVRERVSYSAAYGDERIPALLFLPRYQEPPYQAVVVFPGSAALMGGEAEAFSHPMIGYIVKSGRAVMLPVYKGTYERSTGLEDDNPDMSANYRDHVVMWSKDLGRSIDYLESRDDIDASRIGYFGESWGAGVGAILAAVEPRLSAVVLNAGGFWNTMTRPEVDQRVFAPRVRTPVLLLGGRSDPFFPLESSQLPMYHALGTPEDQKRHVVYESGHSVPLLQATHEIYDWLDQYLGPVR